MRWFKRKVVGTLNIHDYGDEQYDSWTNPQPPRVVSGREIYTGKKIAEFGGKHPRLEGHIVTLTLGLLGKIIEINPN